jgi:hypothetical protein
MKKDSSRQMKCEFIKYFQGSDAENRLTDTIKSKLIEIILF